MISLIVATVGNKTDELRRLFESLERQRFTDYEVIVVSQDNHDVVGGIVSEFRGTALQVRLNRRGLAYARNEGIRYLSQRSGIVSFPDDDCWFPEDGLSIIAESFNQNPSEVLSFRIYDPLTNNFYKGYPERPDGNLSWTQIFKKCSIELFFRLDVVKKGIRFDERFGLGGNYPSGEENIFLADVKHAGMTISYLPVTVIHHLKPQRKSRLSFAQLMSKGPMFNRMFNKGTALILLTAFIIKKRSFAEHGWAVFNLYRETLKFNKKAD
ncbi:glycosyltransferase family 2 protein [Chitinophaga parva]|uniref:Glycosyltransferase family 2 protein n=1 Tax=Chitinophaga parva TaxID=2169414 RepID=A0A2T7BKG4_9BACT|nr:glycosyltransferase family A protein [Chitinophaga parva]PUZ28121.1 glycosyltransferase family 2 protein [Chitinophaga parva]